MLGVPSPEIGLQRKRVSAQHRVHFEGVLTVRLVDGPRHALEGRSAKVKLEACDAFDRVVPGGQDEAVASGPDRDVRYRG